MATELAVVKQSEVALTLTKEQIGVIKSSICPSHSDIQVSFYLEYCRVKQIDPFSKMIYSVIRKGRQTFQTSIDFMRTQAENSGKYRGQVGPWWADKDGNWKDIWLDQTIPPTACKVGVLRSDFSEPMYAIALWREYKPPETTDGGDQGFLWRKMPSVMIAKCAEALALRKAFPERMNGLYSDDEMAQAPAVVDYKNHTYQQEFEGKPVEQHDFQHNSHAYCPKCQKDWLKLSDAERNKIMKVPLSTKPETGNGGASELLKVPASSLPVDLGMASGESIPSFGKSVSEVAEKQRESTLRVTGNSDSPSQTVPTIVTAPGEGKGAAQVAPKKSGRRSNAEIKRDFLLAMDKLGAENQSAFLNVLKFLQLSPEELNTVDIPNMKAVYQSTKQLMEEALKATPVSVAAPAEPSEPVSKVCVLSARAQGNLAAVYRNCHHKDPSDTLTLCTMYIPGLREDQVKYSLEWKSEVEAFLEFAVILSSREDLLIASSKRKVANVSWSELYRYMVPVALWDKAHVLKALKSDSIPDSKLGEAIQVSLERNPGDDSEMNWEVI